MAQLTIPQQRVWKSRKIDVAYALRSSEDAVTRTCAAVMESQQRLADSRRALVLSCAALDRTNRKVGYDQAT